MLILILIPKPEPVYSIKYLGNDTFTILCPGDVIEVFNNDTILVCGYVPLHPVKQGTYLDGLELSLLNVSK